LNLSVVLLSAAMAVGITAPVRAETAKPAPRPLAVDVINKSVPTFCAEDDNVHLDFSNPSVRRFRVEARAPAVIGSIVVDSKDPDFTDCTIKDAPPDPGAEVNRVVLHEDERFILVGWKKTGGFWRKSEVTVRSGDRVENHLELVQLHLKRPGGSYEFLVLYPSDGYWRLRPLPPERLPEVAYGTSFLIGPVEQKERPFVAFTDVLYEPGTRTFRMRFARGGEGTLTVGDPGEKAAGVDVVLSGRLPANLPFATLRSMYITDANADSAQVAWKAPGAKGWSIAPVMTFKGGKATEFWLGRSAPSKHNTSAPDTQLMNFGR